MNLIIDIGNTRTKVAAVEEQQVVDNLLCEPLCESDVQDVISKYPTIDKAIVASTAQSAESVVEWLRNMGLYVVEMSSLTPVPLRNGYLTPETLGMDRLAAAVGASQLTESSVAVIFRRECVLVFELCTIIPLDYQCVRLRMKFCL